MLLTVGVLGAGFEVSQAAAAVTQPPQPKSGPGGNDYAHRGWRVSPGRSGADAWYVFEPAGPRPRKAPLAIVMHGYYAFSGYSNMYELIRHTVRKGNVVIYALGDTPRHRFNGRWSDGVPITRLKIQDAAPIRP